MDQTNPIFPMNQEPFNQEPTQEAAQDATARASLRKCTCGFALSAIAAALVVLALRTVCYFTCFDVEIGYFSHGAILPIITAVLSWIAVIGLSAFALLHLRGKEGYYPKRDAVVTRIGAGIAALAFLAWTVSAVTTYAENAQASASLIPLLLNFGASLYFLLVAAGVRRGAYLLVTAACAAARICLALIASYTGMMWIPMNAPSKISFQLGILGALLFLINDLRASVAKPLDGRYFVATGASMVLMGLSAVPNLAAMLTGRMDDLLLFETIAIFGLFVYGVIRLLTVSLDPIPAEPLTSGKPDSEEIQPTTEEIAYIEDESPTENKAPTEESEAPENEQQYEPSRTEEGVEE